jgi:hypothetical protein
MFIPYLKKPLKAIHAVDKPGKAKETPGPPSAKPRLC